MTALSTLYLGANQLDVGMPFQQLVESVLVPFWPAMGALGLGSLGMTGTSLFVRLDAR